MKFLYFTNFIRFIKKFFDLDIKENLFSVLSGAVNSLNILFQSIIFLKFFSLYEVGLYSQTSALLSIIGIFSLSGLNKIIIGELSKNNCEREVLLIIILSTCLYLLATISILFIILKIDKFNLLSQYLYSFGVYYCLSISFNKTLNFFIVKKEFKQIFIYRIFEFIFLIIIFILLINFKLNFIQYLKIFWINKFILSLFLTSIVYFKIKNNLIKINYDKFKKILNNSFQITLYNIPQNLLFDLRPIFIGAFINVEFNGLIYFLTRINNTIKNLLIVLGRYNVLTFLQSNNKLPDKNISKYLRYSIFLIIIFIFSIYLLLPFIDNNGNYGLLKKYLIVCIPLLFSSIRMDIFYKIIYFDGNLKNIKFLRNLEIFFSILFLFLVYWLKIDILIIFYWITSLLFLDFFSKNKAKKIRSV